MKKYSIKNLIYVFFGSTSLALGMIGVFIPVLPTTPFLLLAAFCYIRSSKKLYHWLISHRVFGIYIYNYMTYKAVTKSTKIGALLFLWLSLIISIMIINNTRVSIILLAVGVGVSIHLITLKTMQLEDMQT
jgi:uncharacterized membrane protein YbaN (DUF454 family)